MQQTVLAEHLSRQFHTNVRMYSCERIFLGCISNRIDLTDLNDPFFDLPESSLIWDLASEESPVVFSVDSNVLYGLVFTEDALWVVGPMLAPPLFSLKHQEDSILLPQELRLLLNPVAITDLLSSLLLVHNLFHETPVSHYDAMLYNSMQEEFNKSSSLENTTLLFSNRELNASHTPYEHELREMKCIEEGNEAMLRKCWSEEYAGNWGITSPDPQRNGRNLGLIVIALASRAAIRGGAVPEAALSLGDSYMQKVEALQNLFDMDPLVKDAELAFTAMVADRNRSRWTKKEAPDESESPIIERCLDYINAHLHERLTVASVAEHLHIHPNYLSHLFTEHEGITLYRYILNEKISLAKNLLIYSEYSYGDIANYLAFSSQSHLGKLFREETGMTMRTFRQRYQYKSVSGTGDGSSFHF